MSKAREADYLGEAAVITSHDPLQGKLLLVTEDDEQIELHLDKDSAEALVSALGIFLLEGVIGPL